MRIMVYSDKGVVEPKSMETVKDGELYDFFGNKVDRPIEPTIDPIDVE